MNVEKRITKLERELRYWRLAVVAPVLLVLLIATDKPAVPDVVKARSFEVVSDDGTARGVFGIDSIGTRLVIMNELGNVVVEIAEHEESGALVLSASDGTPGVIAFGSIDEFDHGIIGTYTRAGVSLWTSTYGELPEE